MDNELKSIKVRIKKINRVYNPIIKVGDVCTLHLNGFKSVIETLDGSRYYMSDLCMSVSNSCAYMDLIKKL